MLDGIVEILLTIFVDVLSDMKYKRPATRTWVMSGFFTVLGLAMVGFCVWGAVSLFCQGSMIGMAVLAVITVATAVVFCVVVIRGHKRNWDRY